MVAHAAGAHAGFGEAGVHREQFDGGDAEIAQMGDDGGMRESGVRSAQVLGHVGMCRGEGADVQFVDDGGVPVGLEAGASAALGGGGDDGEGNVATGVAVGSASERFVVVRQERVGVAEAAGDATRVGIEEQLAGIETAAGLGVPGTVRAQPVTGAHRGVGDDAVPDPVGPFGQAVARLGAVVVDHADVHRGGLGRVDGEGDTAVDGVRAEREGTAGSRQGAGGRVIVRHARQSCRVGPGGVGQDGRRVRT